MDFSITARKSVVGELRQGREPGAWLFGINSLLVLLFIESDVRLLAVHCSGSRSSLWVSYIHSIVQIIGLEPMT
jgi:hypothetical protein